MISRIRRRQPDPTVSPGAQTLSVHPVLRRVYAARGIHSVEDIDYRAARLLPPKGLDGLSEAAALVSRHLSEGPILIVGDFDADGATATALLKSGLEAMGAAAVDYLVPNRFDFGYGLSPELLEVARERDPALIITVDNGISSIEGVAAARAAGIDVLVTDHHLPGETLPGANAILNPNLPGQGFASPHLAGVGVAFYLLLGLRQHLRDAQWFEQQAIPEPSLAEWLDLVALGTVADLVPLDRNNRILVHQGLQRIRAGSLRPGLEALIRVADRNRADLTAADLGFAIAPRLNAAGRLDDISHGIETLLARDPGRARAGAEMLDAMNRERRYLQRDMQEQAERALERIKLDGGAELPAALTLFRTDWHSGIVGLLASRLKERFHRPVAVMAPDGDRMLKGSLRSVPGIHIRDVLADMDSRQPGMIERFGGHAMAAGLSLRSDRLDSFRRLFKEAVEARAGAETLSGIIHSDGPLEVSELSLEVAELIRRHGPWGQGFPEPLFDGEFRVLEERVVGEHHLKLRLQHPDAATPIDAIAFNPPPEQLGGLPEWIRIAYRLEVNEWQGLRRPQLLVVLIEPL
ncbi:single-stranded-DNA-specific exonuclease RecJ [Gammaproteobacteria bacterium AB-CW1]|uniref:Single-stranded-DNA-specific exonuclease RecJ n=1 Tax=Natronospira elongata TaxID=3110268 RepID=A0AAP6MML6_9GAMM|nr:single-stranded-DNA-specific exonuclease RecJ [Gammaproteobacteria bacterium AB-CW1]